MITEERVKVEGQPHLRKDMETGIVHNVDTAGFHAFVENRRKKLELEERVNGLESKIDLILSLLKEKNQ